MNIDNFMENIIEQIKEAHLKLGFVKEVIRLYFPAQNRMHGTIASGWKWGILFTIDLQKTIMNNCEIEKEQGTLE